MILEFGLPEPLVEPAADCIPRGATLVRVRDLHRVEQMLANSSGLPLGMNGPSARLLLHAVVRKNRGRTRASVAEELGVRPTSLARIGSRLVGQPLSSVGEDVRTHAFAQILRQAAGLDHPEIPPGMPTDGPASSTG